MVVRCTRTHITNLSSFAAINKTHVGSVIGVSTAAAASGTTIDSAGLLFDGVRCRVGDALSVRCSARGDACCASVGVVAVVVIGIVGTLSLAVSVVIVVTTTVVDGDAVLFDAVSASISSASAFDDCGARMLDIVGGALSVARHTTNAY